MRRFCSILALMVMMCPTALPLWASTASSADVMSCHRTPLHKGSAPAKSVHHCHDMGGMVATESETGPVVAAYGASEKCPMNCCVQAVAPGVAALPASSFFPPLHVLETSFHGLGITFSRVGFSSHTDRGPPSL